MSHEVNQFRDCRSYKTQIDQYVKFQNIQPLQHPADGTVKLSIDDRFVYNIMMRVNSKTRPPSANLCMLNSHIMEKH